MEYKLIFGEISRAYSTAPCGYVQLIFDSVIIHSVPVEVAQKLREKYSGKNRSTGEGSVV